MRRRARAGGPVALVLWLCCLGSAAALLALAVGTLRLAAIDSGAADVATGTEIVALGHVVAVPRREDGEVRFPLETPHGRLLVVAHEPLGELPVGGEVRARGRVRDPEPWRVAALERLGIRDVLVARSVGLTGGRRGGLWGELDRVRDRAESALGRGTTPAAASLLRGFVLGQDDRIAPRTVEEFKRSGLAHLLAVSGQNVLLLALLAAALLALLGVPLRARLGWTLALIAIYVPVAGAGPSIQRAGVMGAVGIVAALASRPSSRWYALLLAATATLALNPRSGGDVGWQLSFAAVAGILLWSRPLAALLAPSGAAPLRSGLAEGAAMTLAATVATAPLMAHHFGAVSVVTVAANLVALPAVAPVMWLGMLAAAAGQLPFLPVEPVTWLAGLLAGYVAQVGRWFGSPAWAQAELSLGVPGLALAYLALATGARLALEWASRRRGLRAALPRPERRGGEPGSDRRQRLGRGLRRRALAAAALAAAALLIAGGFAPEPAERPPAGLRVSVLDVGQGDSILLEPRGHDPVLVDAGPASAGVAERLRERGVDRLAALVVTHPQADHAGGAPAVIELLEPSLVVHGRGDRSLRHLAAAAGVRGAAVAAGRVIRVGRLRLEVLWPRPGLAPATGDEDPNRRSLVMLARWGRFELLLSGDAEAEAAPVDPGPIDVLKLAHHGSEDAGLGTLLDRSGPRLALISVGAGNAYGHPAPATIEALAERGIAVARTDRDGEITIEASGRRWSVR